MVERGSRYYVYYRGQLLIITTNKRVAQHMKENPAEAGFKCREIKNEQ